MRRILYGDIVAVASVIRYVDPGTRGGLLESMIYQAHCADKFRKRFGLRCAGLGDGSLEASCSGLPKAVVGHFGDPDFADCMRQVFEAIIEWRTTQRTRGGNVVALP